MGKETNVPYMQAEGHYYFGKMYKDKGDKENAKEHLNKALEIFKNLETEEFVSRVKKELGAGTPVHFTRFYPLHKLQRLPPTPISTLEKAREAALSCGLEYVYIGNVPGHNAWNTFCQKCKKMIIQRSGYMIGEMHLKEGRCEYCGGHVPGIWASGKG